VLQTSLWRVPDLLRALKTRVPASNHPPAEGRSTCDRGGLGRSRRDGVPPWGFECSATKSYRRDRCFTLPV